MPVLYDLESIPTNDPRVIAHIHANMKPPGNMSKPDTIKKWLEDPVNLDKEIAKTSLDGAFGRVCVLAMASDQGPIEIFTLREISEAAIVNAFRSVYIDTHPQRVQTRNKIVGFNSRAFDLPFLHKRSLVHGMGAIIPAESRPWEHNHLDVMVEWVGGSRDMVKQSKVAMALGLPANEDDITGADVAEKWNNGEHELVEYHAMKDVEQLRAMYYTMYPNG